MEELNYYRVLFSFMAPREGIIDVQAKDEEGAKKVVQDLMGNNYKDFVIASVTPFDPKEMIANTFEENTQEPNKLN